MARTRYQRMEAKVRTFLDLDAKELVRLEEDFEEVLDEVVLPRAAEAKANAIQVQEADMDLILAFPLYPQVQDLFDSQGDSEHFPSWDEIMKFAHRNAERERNGQDPKQLPWEDDPWAAEADEVYRACKRAEKQRMRSGRAQTSLVNKAKALYERRAGEAEALLNAKCVAAYDFAIEWLDDRMDSVDELKRANRRLAMLADEEELAKINRGLRAGSSKAKMAMEFREMRERIMDPEVQSALGELLSALVVKKGNGTRLTEPAEA